MSVGAVAASTAIALLHVFVWYCTLLMMLLLVLNIHDDRPRPFDRIYQFVSLMRRPGSFPLSLYMSFRSCSCSSTSSSFRSCSCSSSFDRIYRSVSVRVVSVLFLFVFLYLSVRLFIVSLRIFSCLFTCRFDPFLVRVLFHSTVPIRLSHYRVVQYLFSSLYVLFRPCSSSSSSSSYSYR